MKQLIAALLLTTAAVAQCPTGSVCITIPAQSVPVTWNGRTLHVNIPAQTVPLPASSIGSLPAGLTWTPASGSAAGTLTIPGNISAASISLTGGPALPTSASGLYLMQLQATGFLTPVPYVPVALPTISQADPTTNSFTTP